jgi:hypothetical protein
MRKNDIHSFNFPVQIADDPPKTGLAHRWTGLASFGSSEAP